MCYVQLCTAYVEHIEWYNEYNDKNDHHQRYLPIRGQNQPVTPTVSGVLKCFLYQAAFSWIQIPYYHQVSVWKMFGIKLMHLDALSFMWFYIQYIQNRSSRFKGLFILSRSAFVIFLLERMRVFPRIRYFKYRTDIEPHLCDEMLSLASVKQRAPQTNFIVYVSICSCLRLNEQTV